jgi:hypothetical protein
MGYVFSTIFLDCWIELLQYQTNILDWIVDGNPIFASDCGLDCNPKLLDWSQHCPYPFSCIDLVSGGEMFETATVVVKLFGTQAAMKRGALQPVDEGGGAGAGRALVERRVVVTASAGGRL